MSDREHAAPEREKQERSGTLTVGAANDVAEHDADRRADEALSWLAGQQPLDRAEPEGPHVHTGACGVSRSHAPGDGAIGAEGGVVDAGTQTEIERTVGGGEGLGGAVRTTMEAAFDADLGKVRVHRGARADHLSRSISAEAFTTGNDIFFSQGAFDPGSARGQRVLAHEIGHVMQQRAGSVGRLWNPFKKKTQEEKDAAEAKAKEEKARKSELTSKKAANKATDKQVRATAGKVNADHKALTKKIKLSYEASDQAKTMTPVDLVDLQTRFQSCLDEEKAARKRVYDRHAGAVDPAMLEQLAEKEGELVWGNAPDDVRSLRPLRFDDFDKALKEVREMAAEGRIAQQQRAAQLLAENEKSLGAPMSPEKAKKKVLEERVLERRTERIRDKQDAKAVGKGEGKTDHEAEIKKRVAEKMAELKPGTGAKERLLLQKKFEAEIRNELYGTNEDVAEYQGYIDDATTGTKILGKVTKGSTALPMAFGVAKNNDGIEGTELAGRCTGGLSDILGLVSQIMTFATTVGEISKGAADKGAKLQAAQEFVGILSKATATTRTVLFATKEGVSAFGDPASIVLGQVATAMPIVGLISSTFGVIDGVLELIPVVQRHVDGVAGGEEALLTDKVPLAASYDRVNSRTAQLIEKSSFDIAKNVTMMGIQIAEVATAGGFGAPAAAKLTVTIVDLLHSVGHAIYDTVNEQKSSNAIKAFDVKKQEGASRDVLKYDVGSSVDVIIVAAKKHKQQFARQTLIGYGVTEAEIDTMWLDELRKKVIKGLKAAEDPKTVGEKIQGVKDTVAEKLDLADKPAGTPSDPRGTLEKLADKIAKKKQAFHDNMADARQMVSTKNALGTSGRTDRGKASTLFYAMRGDDKNEKSLAKLRAQMFDQGTTTADQPRTTSDKKARAEIDALRKGERTPDQLERDKDMPQQKVAAPLPPGYVEEISMLTLEQLKDRVAQIGVPDEKTPPLTKAVLEHKLELLRAEVQLRRTQADKQDA